MKYHIINVHYSAGVGYVIFVTADESVMNEYHALTEKLDVEGRNIIDISVRYTHKMTWILFGPRSESIYRIIVKEGDFSTLHEKVIKFFNEKNIPSP